MLFEPTVPNQTPYLLQVCTTPRWWYWPLLPRWPGSSSWASTTRAGRGCWCRPTSGGSPGTVLYCTVLYCTVLYCTVLYCTVQSVVCIQHFNCAGSVLIYWIWEKAWAKHQFHRSCKLQHNVQYLHHWLEMSSSHCTALWEAMLC